jgi:hypothetical protein
MDAVFRRFARPTPDELRTLTRGAAPVAPVAGGGTAALPAPPEPDSDDVTGGSAPEGATAPCAEFSTASEAGLGLPSARNTRPAMRPWVFEPRSPLAERSLVIAWRRLRSIQREGPAVELDVEGTVAAQCRQGWLLQPVMRPARRNRARLLVLVDASPSMLPWRGLLEPLADSLRQSRLAAAELLFFENDPRDGLYASAQLQGRCQLAAALHDPAGARALLVIGDAGCARGRRDRSRLAGTRQFVADARRQSRALAWLNPMPAARWGNAAAAVRPGGAMFELSDDGLTQAVDHLRGLHRG